MPAGAAVQVGQRDAPRFAVPLVLDRAVDPGDVRQDAFVAAVSRLDKLTDLQWPCRDVSDVLGARPRGVNFRILLGGCGGVVPGALAGAANFPRFYLPLPAVANFGCAALPVAGDHASRSQDVRADKRVRDLVEEGVADRGRLG